jgi:L-ascorbate metabolism protein UlaG (beta-lactamase superfamily)
MKLFECFWGDGYRGDDNKSILAYHDMDFFTEDRGYEQEYINDIANLEIGDYADFSFVTGNHWVRRMS